MPVPLRLSLSSTYRLRWPGLSNNLDGAIVDPRMLYVVQFQLLAFSATAFGAWTAGTWDTEAPPHGPYGATVLVGVGQPAPVNPGAAGTYIVWGRFTGESESPAFQAGTVTLSAP